MKPRIIEKLIGTQALKIFLCMASFPRLAELVMVEIRKITPSALRIDFCFEKYKTDSFGWGGVGVGRLGDNKFPY